MADESRIVLIGREATEGVLPAAPAAWAATTPLALGARRRKVADDGTVFEVTTAGTTGATEPVWPTAIGATVSDGSVTWTHAGFRMWNLPMMDASNKLGRKRILTKEHNGTRMRSNKAKRGASSSSFMLKMLGYYDLLGIPMLSAFGDPQVAAVSGATGAFDATFKAGSANPPTLAIQFYDGAEWWQQLGCSVDNFDVTFTAEALPIFSFDFNTREATKISAPSIIPAQVYANYSHPWDIPQQSVTLNGSAWADLVSGKFSLKNGRKPLFTIGSPSMRRALQGEVDAAVDIKALYLAYAGSLLEDLIDNTDPGALVMVVTDDVVTIGTGTPQPPRMLLTVPDLELTDGDSDPSNTNTQMNVKAAGAYHASSATVLSMALRNQWPAVVYEGN
jgi:hypothetical protein